MKFELTESQIKEYHAWRKRLDKLQPATIGGSETFCFTPTGLGVILKVKRVDGKEIDLTEVDKW